MKLSLAACAASMGAELLAPGGGPGTAEVAKAMAEGYSIDSRSIAPGELFFAVAGERYDAHTFVPGAGERGAVGAVVAAARVAGLRERAPGLPLLAVDDPLLALQRLGAAVRRHWGGTLVGLTGSAGKTTTKEMVAAVLAARHPVLKSAGNLNNHFGVPLQLLRLEPEHHYAVLEMGMSSAGEIRLLARMAAPDWGVVTNVGMAHAGNFPDGIEGVARAKRELVEALAPATGVALLNADDPRVAGFARAFRGRSVLAGRSETAEVRALEVEDHGAGGLSMRVRAGGEEARVHLQLLGAHNATNALLALAAGREAGVPLEAGGAALAQLQPGDRRGQLLRVRGAAVIDDCYNSNPAALGAMIGALMQLPAERHILVAGEMLELGPETGALHAAAGQQAVRAGVDWVLGVQGAALALAEEAAKLGVPALFFETAAEAGQWLGRELRAGDAVLVKGSRGVGLEGALQELRGAEGGASRR